jgi:SAM-dependent methyltransferase
MAAKERPAWQLPAGVSRGTWDYVNDASIATEYDRFHSEHPLLKLDQEIIASVVPSQPHRSDGEKRIAIDFGCGTGRSLIPLASSGWNVVGVDLSREMLREYGVRAHALGLDHSCGKVYANMAQLNGFQDRVADAIFCMYSSLGMVQGRENRRSFLGHVFRLLRDDGVFLVHVHNRGTWFQDPGGIVRAFKDRIRSYRDPTWEYGDRIYPYRGLPTMFLHIFSEKELISDLRSAGLHVRDLLRLNRESSQIAKGTWFPYLQCGGFIAVCVKSAPRVRGGARPLGRGI